MPQTTLNEAISLSRDWNAIETRAAVLAISKLQRDVTVVFPKSFYYHYY